MKWGSVGAVEPSEFGFGVGLDSADNLGCLGVVVGYFVVLLEDYGFVCWRKLRIK